MTQFHWLNFGFSQLQDAVEYAECEAVVKDYPPFIEAMKRRGIDDMDLVMVDPWSVNYKQYVDLSLLFYTHY